MADQALQADSPVQYLKTVGPQRARALARLGIETVTDLLAHYPRRYFDRSRITTVGGAVPGQDVTVVGEVMTSGQRRTRRGRSLQTVTVADATGVVYCVWFNQPWLVKQLRGGTRLMCSGEIQLHAGRKQLMHPDFELISSDAEQVHTGRLVPQYSLTSGIGQHWLRKLIHATLQALDEPLPETLPASVRSRRDLCGHDEATRGIHFPADAAECDRSRRRLVYEELFLQQVAIARRRGLRRVRTGIQLQKPGDLTTRFVAGLPFELTGAQRRVLTEILGDMRGGQVMHRLLQGDVGCGKTLVALIAALFVIEQGYQALLMAPTEVLARQHERNLTRHLEGLDLTCATLTGATPKRERDRLLRDAGRGDIDLLIGTHAVIQDEMPLANPGLAIVDEQHRFGVRQRGRAARRGCTETPPHILVMSATPIPRSLSLTLYGDLDLSVIDELPAGRQPIETELCRGEDEARVHEAVAAEAVAGRQAYIVYPVIEETEGQDLKAATVEYERLAAEVFADRRVALLHGRLKAKEKESVMAEFAAGAIDVLVATTVIEVGVDVPNATTMVIHHPERFGLAQLHQLRGRIGRGTARSCCYLMTEGWSAPETRERIEFFAEHIDGFDLAEEDLRRRGPGDVWGLRQHGLPGFRLANPLRDAEVVKECVADTESLLREDPELRSKRMRSLREALAAFDENSGPGRSG